MNQEEKIPVPEKDEDLKEFINFLYETIGNMQTEGSRNDLIEKYLKWVEKIEKGEKVGFSEFILLLIRKWAGRENREKGKKIIKQVFGRDVSSFSIDDRIKELSVNDLTKT